MKERADQRRELVAKALKEYAQNVRSRTDEQLILDHNAHVRSQSTELAEITRAELHRRNLKFED
jgi:hypothetical protein